MAYTEIARLRHQMADMQRGFASLDEAERRGESVWRRRATLGARYQKAAHKLARLQQMALPLDRVKTDE